MPEVQGAMEAILRAILDGGGADRGVPEGLSEAAQCYHAIRALANLSKCVPELQGASSCRAGQEAPCQLAGPLRKWMARWETQRLRG